MLDHQIFTKINLGIKQQLTEQLWNIGKHICDCDVIIPTCCACRIIIEVAVDGTSFCDVIESESELVLLTATGRTVQ